MNPFDQLAGMDCDLSGICNDSDLGFLKRIKKELKRSTKKVKKEVKRNPAIAGALVVAAGVMLSPAAGAALKAGLAKGSAAALKGGSLLAKGAGAVVKLAPVASQVMQSKAQVAQAKAAVATVAENSAIAIDNQTPEFKRLVETMRAQGYSDEQIVQTWLQSQAYVDTTKTAVIQNMGHQLQEQYQNFGYDQSQAQQLAYEEAGELGEEAARAMRAQNLPGGLPLILGGAALLFLLLNR